MLVHYIMRQSGRQGQVGEALPKILRRRLSAKGRLGPDRAVDPLPTAQCIVQAGQIQSTPVVGIELFLAGVLAPLDIAVELGGAGWQNEESDAAFHAGLFELGLAVR